MKHAIGSVVRILSDRYENQPHMVVGYNSTDDEYEVFYDGDAFWVTADELEDWSKQRDEAEEEESDIRDDLKHRYGDEFF